MSIKGQKSQSTQKDQIVATKRAKNNIKKTLTT